MVATAFPVRHRGFSGELVGQKFGVFLRSAGLAGMVGLVVLSEAFHVVAGAAHGSEEVGAFGVFAKHLGAADGQRQSGG